MNSFPEVGRDRESSREWGGVIRNHTAALFPPFSPFDPQKKQSKTKRSFLILLFSLWASSKSSDSPASTSARIWKDSRRREKSSLFFKGRLPFVFLFLLKEKRKKDSAASEFPQTHSRSSFRARLAHLLACSFTLNFNIFLQQYKFVYLFSTESEYFFSLVIKLGLGKNPKTGHGVFN